MIKHIFPPRVSEDGLDIMTYNGKESISIGNMALGMSFFRLFKDYPTNPRFYQCSQI